MRIILSPKAEKQLRKLPRIDQVALVRKIRAIKDEKDVSQVERLRGFKNIFRVRVADYRIVYKRIADEIYVVIIGHRKDIYKVLARLLG
ncbi:type II toxin-antitoxin system RelE/ParE family toxin [Patescibacteria group bacterium]|nr:type II toxin-antitoxin system RelE/ParE family toxin [Patescibacteria group bacterium]